MTYTTLKNTRQGSLSGNDSGGFITAFEHPSSGCFNMKRIEYQRGDQIGECIYLYDIDVYISPQGDKLRMAMFICKRCGEMFNTTIANVKTKHTTSCGCYNIEVVKLMRTKHGLSNHTLFNRWLAIRNRCYLMSNRQYKDWGGRGIKMCDEWRHDFMAFYDYVTSLPGFDLKLTIDRINNNGNYEPGNIRWATAKQQANNKRKYKNSKK